MRILMGIQRLWRGGGTETHVITLSNQLRRLGHQVIIYTGGGAWVQKVRSTGIQVQIDSGLLNSSRRWVSQQKLRRYLVQHRFDVFHAHDARSLEFFTGATAGILKRPKVVMTVHGPYVHGSALRRAQNSADAIIAVSSEIRRSFPIFVNRNKVHVVPNGIRTDLFRPTSRKAFRQLHNIPVNAFVVGYCGRFTFDKVALGRRIGLALKSFATSHPEVHVVIAGRGSQLVMSPSRRVHVVGHVDRMPSFLNACDVVIATGRTAAESLLCGVPVISIGKAGYHGIVTERNVQRMMQSNFGDHGTFRTWTTGVLYRDLLRVQRLRARFRKRTTVARRNILYRLSARQMAAQVQGVYRKRSPLKGARHKKSSV